MATVADLNVRIGVLYKDLDEGLKGAERSLQRSGRRLSALGSELTLAISAPLALLGGAAIKSAGNLESLELALQSQPGSAGAARKELSLLREEALKPGLGFEQAVKGSVSLQAVGFEANEARKVLSEFGNALALAGKGKAELDGVVLALTQISAKGIVSAEEINQIAERLPQIRTLMLEAFGTASTEQIQKLGITAEQFIQGITSKMEGLPRAAGGIKNSLENLGDATTNFLANIGKEIARVFDLEKNAQRLSAALADVSDWFMNLSDSTKQWIVAVGAGLVAVGPLVKVFGVLQSAIATNISLLAPFGKAIVAVGGYFVEATKSTQTLTEYTVNYGRALAGTTQSVGNVTRAFAAFTSLGLVAVLGAIAAGVYLLSDRLDAAKFATDQFNRAKEETIVAAAKETAELNKNFDVLKNVNSSQGERKRAIDELNRIYPEYLKGIDLEKASASDLTRIHKGLNDQILRGIAERQKASAVNAIYEKQAQILLRIQEIQRTGKTTTGENALIDTGDMLAAGSRAGAIIKKLQQQVADLGTQANVTAKDFDAAFGLQSRAVDMAAESEAKARQAYYDSRDALEGNTAAAKKNAGATAQVAANTGAAAKKTAEYAKSLASIRAVADKGQVLGADVVAEQAAEIERQIERLLEKGFRPAGKEIQHLKSMLVGLFDGFKTPELPTIPTLNLIPDALASIEVSVKGTDEIKALAAAADDWNRAVGESKTSSEEALAIFQQWQQGAIVGTAALEQMSQAFAKNNEAITYWQTQAGDAITAFGASIASSLEDGALSMQSFAQATIAATGQILGAILKQFVANLLLKSALFSKNPLVALAVAGVAGSIGTALFKKTIGAAALAKGGVIDEPTLALVGEYSGAKSNPEIVTPENKMREVFAGVLSGFMGAGLPALAPASIALPSGIGRPSGGLSAGQSYNNLVFPEIITYLKGTDIAIAVDKATRSRSRAK